MCTAWNSLLATVSSLCARTKMKERGVVPFKKKGTEAFEVFCIAKHRVSDSVSFSRFFGPIAVSRSTQHFHESSIIQFIRRRAKKSTVFTRLRIIVERSNKEKKTVFTFQSACRRNLFDAGRNYSKSKKATWRNKKYCALALARISPLSFPVSRRRSFYLLIDERDGRMCYFLFL